MNTSLNSPLSRDGPAGKLDPHHPASKGAPFVVAVANQKGGVAKTTTVVSLGGALVSQGLEVLLIDLDPQANLSLALGVDPNRVRGGMAEVLLNSSGLSGLTRETRLPGLDLAPSNADLETTERFLPLRQNYELRLKEALSGRLTYDFVLMDCPPALGALTINALNAANLLVIPTQLEYFSIHALGSMINLVRRVRGGHNPSLLFRILITLEDRRNQIHRQLSEQIRTNFKEGIFNSVIGIDTKLRESAAAGIPITEYARNSRSARQYSELAKEICAYVQK